MYFNWDNVGENQKEMEQKQCTAVVISPKVSVSLGN